MNDLGALLDFGRDAFAAGFAVFLRIGAAMALLPAFGEQSVPMRVRLGIGLAFTAIVAPAVAPISATGALRPGIAPVLWISEPLIGLAFGFSLLLLIVVLRVAGTIIAQSTSLSQAFAASGAEPSPVVGEILVLAGLAIAVSANLHLRLAEALIATYDHFPPGAWPPADGLLSWAVARISQAFALSFSLAMPFVIAALIYNVALGIINRAMPQLMVAMVGAPALTLGGLALMIVVLPVALTVWNGRLAEVLAAPF